MQSVCHGRVRPIVSECEKDLRRIASHTKGEHTYYDVTNEAWLMAYRCFAKARAITAGQHALLLAPPASASILRP